MKRLFSAVALSALMAGAALAAEPLTLSDSQMDGVSAGGFVTGAGTTGFAQSNNIAASSSSSAYAEAAHSFFPTPCNCAQATTTGFAGSQPY